MGPGQSRHWCREGKIGAVSGWSTVSKPEQGKEGVPSRGWSDLMWGVELGRDEGGIYADMVNHSQDASHSCQRRIT